MPTGHTITETFLYHQRSAPFKRAQEPVVGYFELALGDFPSQVKVIARTMG